MQADKKYVRVYTAAAFVPPDYNNNPEMENKLFAEDEQHSDEVAAEGAEFLGREGQLKIVLKPTLPMTTEESQPEGVD